jgi:hypothetical protein
MFLEDVLSELRKGKAVTNINWNGDGMYLKVQFPDTKSKMERPYIYINPGIGWKVPWTPSQFDLFSNGWEIVEEKNL